MIKAHYILSLAILYSHFTYGQNIQSQWQELYQKSWQQVPYTVTQNELHQYPMTLLKSSAVYPNFTQVDWNDLRLIEHVSTIFIGV